MNEIGKIFFHEIFLYTEAYTEVVEAYCHNSQLTFCIGDKVLVANLQHQCWIYGQTHCKTVWRVHTTSIEDSE